MDVYNHQVYQTDGNNTDLLNRTYSLQQYFYCKRCKTFYLTETSEDSYDDGLSIPCNTSSMCSSVQMVEAVIYPGNIEADGMKSEYEMSSSVSWVWDGVAIVWAWGLMCTL